MGANIKPPGGLWGGMCIALHGSIGVRNPVWELGGGHTSGVVWMTLGFGGEFTGGAIDFWV